MKKTLVSVALLSTFAMAFNMGGAMDSIDKTKAKDSVDTEKAMAAASKGKNITLADVNDTVDTTKAIDSVDKDKLMKSLY